MGDRVGMECAGRHSERLHRAIGLAVSRHSPLTAGQAQGLPCDSNRLPPPPAAPTQLALLVAQRHPFLTPHMQQAPLQTAGPSPLLNSHPPSSASSSLSATLRAGRFCSRASMTRCSAAASTSLRFASSPLLPAGHGDGGMDRGVVG